MNEDFTEPPLSDDIDGSGLTLSQIIASVLDEAVAEVFATAEFGDGDDMMPLTGTAEVEGDHALLRLPPDYMSLRELTARGWDGRVTRAVTAESPEYRDRNSVSALRRGTRRFPRAYEMRDENGRYLELHPAPEDGRILTGRYLADPFMHDDGRFYFPSRLLVPIVAAAARRARAVLEEGK